MIVKDICDIFAHNKKGYHERQSFLTLSRLQTFYASLEGDQLGAER